MATYNKMTKTRCAWLPEGKPDYTEYHDTEWGVPVREDTKLFEMLILEGAQAGLSWYTILKRRAGYQNAFCHFDVKRCAALSDCELENILLTGNIIRHRLKVFSVRKNAQVFLAIQNEFGSFSAYLWQHVQDKPILNKPQHLKDVPVKTALSDAIAKDLKKRGMTFVGSTIVYAYLQAVGVVNDHMTTCYYCPD